MKLTARSRLTFFFTALFALLLISSFAILYFRVAQSLDKDFHFEMVHDGRIFAELFKEELKLNALDEFKDEIKEFGVELQVLDEAGKPVVQSDGWQSTGVVVEKDSLVSVRESASFKEIFIGKKPGALFSRPVQIPGRGYYSLHIVRFQDSLRKTTGKILLWMFIIAPLMVLLSLITGGLIATKVLKAEQEAFDRLKNFTADVAHELRIPLTSLRGGLEVALRKDRSAPEYRDAVAAALEDAENLSRLTQDLLLLAETDAAQLKLNIQEVDLRKFMEEAFAQVSELTNQKQIKKHLLLPLEAKVRFDPDRMREVILNLMDNAIKYGRPNGELTLGAGLTEDQVKFTVRDDGIGIPKADQEKIFNRFYRVDKSRSREQGGAGLGLSIVRSIVEAHRGRVDVQSQEGRGSTFTVIIPRIPG